MDKHPAGPLNCTFWMRQAGHRSSLLWDGPSEGQVCTCPKILLEKLYSLLTIRVCVSEIWRTNTYSSYWWQRFCYYYISFKKKYIDVVNLSLTRNYSTVIECYINIMLTWWVCVCEIWRTNTLLFSYKSYLSYWWQRFCYYYISFFKNTLMLKFISLKHNYYVVNECYINTMLLHLQAWVGVLNCRHRFTCMPEVGLDQQVATYITNARLGGLLCVPNIDLDHALITALVERWWQKMHAFHLPHGKITITLQDMEVIMRVPVEGLLVVWKTKLEWGDLCKKHGCAVWDKIKTMLAWDNV